MACGTDKADAFNPAPIRARPGLQISASGSPVPVPYGSRGELVSRSAELGPSAGIMPHSTERSLGPRGALIPTRVFPAAAPRGVAEWPEAESRGLADPEIPSTSRPLSRIGDPALEWAARYPVRPSVGDWLPMHGRAREVAPGIDGGRSQAFAHSFPQATVEKLLPFDFLAKKRLRAFDLEVRRLRMLAKPRVLLGAGLSGLDAAQALRGKPGTPGGFQGSGRQELALPTRLRGRRREQDLAPTPIVRRMAAEARRYGGRV